MVQSNTIYKNKETALHDDFLFLIKKAQKGCKESRKIIVKNYVKLVIDTMYRYPPVKNSYDNLFRAGTIGLIKAVYYYNEPTTENFTSFATSLIEEEILYCLERYEKILN